MTKPRRVITLTPPSSPPPPPGTCWFCQGRFPFPAVGANGRRITDKLYCSASCRIAAATRRQHARRSGQQIEPGTYTGPAQYTQHRPVSGPPASAVTGRYGTAEKPQGGQVRWGSVGVSDGVTPDWWG